MRDNSARSAIPPHAAPIGRLAVVLAAVAVVAAALMATAPQAATMIGRAIATPQVAAPGSEPIVASRPQPPYSWRAPSPGSAFVLDSEPGVRARLLLVSPNGQSQHVAELGGNPMVAVAPSAGLVALASTADGRDSVKMLRLSDGALVSDIALEHRLMTLAPVATMTFSPDGRYLYVLTHEILGPGVDRYGIRSIDVRTGSSGSTADLGNCGVGTAVSLANGVAVACANEVLIFRDSDVLRTARRVSPAASSSIAGAAAAGDWIVVVGDTGAVRAVPIDPALGGLGGELALGERRVLPRQVAASGDGRRLYVLAGTAAERVRGVGSQLIIVDALTLRTLSVVPVNGSSVSVSRESPRVFVLDRASGSVRTFDLSGKPISDTTGVGSTPWLVLSTH